MARAPETFDANRQKTAMSTPVPPEATATGSAAESAPLGEGRISTGMRWLDLVLRGGVPKNRVYLITGEAGTGKTTLALQFLLEGVRQGEQVLFVTLAETKAELESVAKSHGMDISQIAIHEMASAEQAKPEQDYTALHPAEVELGDNLEAIVGLVERLKPNRVVIDSLTELRLLAREQVRYRRQVIALKNFLIKSGCTVYFIDVPAPGGPTDSQLQTICHGVIHLERMAPEYGRERRRMLVQKLRGVELYGGFHDYVILKGGLVVWPRLVAAEHARTYEMKPVSSGVPQLDDLMGGGPDLGTTMLVVGAAGVGKTTLCHQYAAAALQRGEYFAWFSFDERMETIYKRSENIGVDLRKHVQEKRCAVQQVDPASVSPGEFIQRVRREVETFGAKTIVIDSLNGYLHAMPGEHYLVIQMHELLSYLSQMGVLSLIVIAQHGMVGTRVDPPVDLSYLADAVVYLRYFEHQGHVRRAISVMKKRGARHEGSIREMRITSEGVWVGQPLSDFRGILSGEPQYIGGHEPLLYEEKARNR